MLPFRETFRAKGRNRQGGRAHIGSAEFLQKNAKFVVSGPDFGCCATLPYTRLVFQRCHVMHPANGSVMSLRSWSMFVIHSKNFHTKLCLKGSSF